MDPVEARRASRAALAASRARGLLFRDAVDKCLASKLSEFRSEKHRRQWRASLDTHAMPEIGGMMVDDIGVADVQRVLTPIWSAKTETASRLRGRIETVLSWASAAGHRSGDNPARWRGNLDALLPRPQKVAKVQHRPALALADAAKWFAALRKREGMAARALEFLALTACRSGEVRGAVWPEIDLQAALWTVPAARTKTGREHRVPLTGAMVALLKAVPRHAESEVVFPAARGGSLGDLAISDLMREMQESEIKAKREGWLDPRSGRPAVPHGLRSTFRDWSAERTDFPHELAETALGHAISSQVERAYRRGDMIEKRRLMMESWHAFLCGKAQSADVIPLAAKQS